MMTNIPVTPIPPPSVKLPEGLSDVVEKTTTTKSSLQESTKNALTGILGAMNQHAGEVIESSSAETVESLPKSKYLDSKAAKGVATILEAAEKKDLPEASRSDFIVKKLDNGKFQITHIPTGKKSAEYRRKEDALLVISRILSGEESFDESIQLSEDDVKNWIASKINAALISLGVPEDKWDAIEDAIFTAALGGGLGDGHPSSETAAAIADMVTELAGTSAAMTPDLVEPGEGDEIGAEVGIEKPVDIDVPEEEPEEEEPEEEEPEEEEPEEPSEAPTELSLDLSDIEAEINRMASEEPEVGSEEKPESDLDQAVSAFLDENPNPSDDELHAWAEENGYETDDAEEAIYRLATTHVQKHVKDDEKKEEACLEGGVAAEKGVTADDVDFDQLQMGIEVEKEHTDDPIEATRIALDHLAEIPDYYTRLKKMEKEAGVKEGRLQEESDVPLQASAEDFTGYILDTLAPDLRASGNYELAKDFETAAYAIEMRFCTDSFISYMENELAVDLEASGFEETAKDVREAVYWMKKCKEGGTKSIESVEESILSEYSTSPGKPWGTVGSKKRSKKLSTKGAAPGLAKAAATVGGVVRGFVSGGFKRQDVADNLLKLKGLPRTEQNTELVMGILKDVKDDEAQASAKIDQMRDRFKAQYTPIFTPGSQLAKQSQPAEGKVPGVRDGTGPNARSYRKKKGLKGRRQAAGMKCPFKGGESVMVPIEGRWTEASVVDIDMEEKQVFLDTGNGVLHVMPFESVSTLKVEQGLVDRLIAGEDALTVVDEMIKSEVLESIKE